MWGLVYEAQALYEAAIINYRLAYFTCPDSMFLDIRLAL